MPPASCTVIVAPQLAVAPMLKWTDRHCRYFLRLLSRHWWLYTEMITTNALLYGPRDRLLAHDPTEAPVALQLGGADPAALAECALMGEQAGYNAINLNVGCPSSRVQAGRFGACLMTEPLLVAECVAAMRARVTIPVTVKTRLGVDNYDSNEFLTRFITPVAAAGCNHFIIHARKAWLKGLSPRQNRDVPLLDYHRVYRIKRDFAHLDISINGGIETLTETEKQLMHVDGVMLGRAVYHNPYLLVHSNRRIFNDDYMPSRHQVINMLLPYIDRQLRQGRSVAAMTRHLLSFFQGQPGAKAWRRYLSNHTHLMGAGVEVISHALALVPEP